MNVLELEWKTQDDILYYETGFEQLHPLPEIVNWMQQQGYSYQLDWQCRRVTAGVYELAFPNEEIKTLFVLKWL